MLTPLIVWIIKKLWRLLRRWEYQTILPVSWETCLRVKKQLLEPYMEQQTASKLRKKYDKAVYCQSTCIFNLYTEHIMQNAGLDELQTGIKIAGRNINNLRYADDATLMAESKEELKSLSMSESEGGEWSSQLKSKY